MTSKPFWIDHEYDREYSGDGVSRYGGYVRQGCSDPWTDDGRHVELAAFAWRRATGPVMVPGYVRRHSRIAAASVERNDWDGGLIAAVTMLLPWPGEFRLLAGQLRDWIGGDWLEPAFRAPGGEELAANRFLLASAELQFPVPLARLPQPPDRARELEAVCRDAVAVLVDELNQAITPVLAAIEIPGIPERSDR